MNRELPPFLRDLLAARPQAGAGVHPWLFKVARHAHAHLPAMEIIQLLEGRVEGCGRAVSRKEIEDAVKNALPCAWQPRNHDAPAPVTAKWPAVNQEKREAIVRAGGGLADLWEASTLKLPDDLAYAEDMIDNLFPGDPLLCCGRSSSDFDTKPREAWRGELDGQSLIVPSPMSAITGQTKDGRESKHTLANTGPRYYLICEFDSGTVDEHAALLLHLGKFAPLACAVHSGNKSLHGWFYVRGLPETMVEEFFRRAVALGADRATWTRSQFVRLPDGTRDNGARQTVFYINFNLIKQIGLEHLRKS